jgi:Protein of unknown function (DUF1488)
MDISFLPGNLSATARNATIKFSALVDGTVCECEITEKALREHFGAKSGLKADLIAAFEAGRHQIQAVAKDRLNYGGRGRCLMETNDFR